MSYLLRLKAAFVMTGVMSTLLGPLLPALSARLRLTDAEAGRFFAAQFCGAMAGSLLFDRVARRLGVRRVLPLSFLVVALGVAGLGWAGHWMGLGIVFVYGTALGLNVAAANLTAVRAPEGMGPAQVTRLNIAFCVGAIGMPPVLGRLLTQWDLSGILLMIAVLLVGSAALTWARGGGGGEEKAKRGDAPAAVFIAGLCFFLYGGIEINISGWLPMLASRMEGIGKGESVFSVSCFWLGMMAGRLAVAGKGRGVGKLPFVQAALVVAGIGITGQLVAQGKWALWAAAFVAGAGCAPVFPSLVALFQRAAGEATGRWIGMVLAAGSSGAAALPWLVGVMSSATGSLRLSLSLLLLLAALLAWSAGRLARGFAGADPQHE